MNNLYTEDNKVDIITSMRGYDAGREPYETRADKQSECWVQTEQNNVKPLPVTEFKFICTRGWPVFVVGT